MTDIPSVIVCRLGRWRRGEQYRFVFITSESRDYFHDEYVEGEPDLGSDGRAYYARYSDSPELESATSRSPTCLTEVEAVERAEQLVGPIEWGCMAKEWARGED